MPDFTQGFQLKNIYKIKKLDKSKNICCRIKLESCNLNVAGKERFAHAHGNAKKCPLISPKTKIAEFSNC